MKKFYLLALALGLSTSSVIAAPVHRLAKTGRNVAAQSLTQKSSDSRMSVRKAPVLKAEDFDVDETWKELGVGTYSDAVMTNLFAGFSNEPVEVTVEESEQTPGLYRVVNPWPEMAGAGTFYLLIDATDPEFVHIPMQNSGVVEEEDGDTWVCSLSTYAVEEYGYEKDEFIEDFPEYNIYMEDGVIYIPSCAPMYMWEDPVSGYCDAGEWIAGVDLYSGYLALPGHEYAEEWESLGEGKFFDGYVGTFISGVETVEQTIEIKESVKTPGLYKLVKPFDYIVESGRDLIIDCTRPEMVVITSQFTGITLNTYGMMYILSLSSNNYDSLEDFLEDYPESCNITLNEGRIEIPAEAMRILLPQYSMTHIFKNDYAEASYVLLPGHESGVESISTDSHAGEIEYYNLQGVRVNSADMTPGLYIKRQGDVTTKVALH